MNIVKLPFKVKRPILACGADLKGAFALAKGGEAYVYDGYGDLADPDNLARYEKAVKVAIRKLGISPAIIACDLHPNYFSTRFAGKIGTDTYFSTAHTIEKWVSVPIFCQHHEAHVASCIVDNSIKGDVIGVAFDGTGYGTDGNIWGGEFFVGSLKKLKRAAHLGYVPMPGGELAIKEPWRMAVGYLHSAYGKEGQTLFGKVFNPLRRNPRALARGMNADGYISASGRELRPLGRRGSTKRVRPLLEIIEKRINSPLTSSAGRLFDAVGSIILGKMTVEKEAELPIELEKIAIELCRDNYKFDIEPEGRELVIHCKKMIKGIVEDLKNKADRPTISSRFHNTVAEMILDISVRLRKRSGIAKVMLSGGVFQNAYLVLRAKELLSRDGFKVFTNSNISTNDSGIPIGQIAIASARARCA